MKVGVPGYFIIIFVVYSFKCSALTSCLGGWLPNREGGGGTTVSKSGVCRGG